MHTHTNYEYYINSWGRQYEYLWSTRMHNNYANRTIYVCVCFVFVLGVADERRGAGQHVMCTHVRLLYCEGP